jgi:hypothetical protein
MNERGGLNWFTILMIPVLIILFIPIASVTSVIVDEAFTVLDNTTNIFYINFIKLLIGSIVFIIAIGITSTQHQNHARHRWDSSKLTLKGKRRSYPCRKGERKE